MTLDRNELYEVARQKMMLGLPSEALTNLDNAIELSSDYPFHEALVLRGIAYRELGDHDAAIVDFDEAVECEGERCQHAYLERGITYLDRHEWGLAINDFDRELSVVASDVYESGSRDRFAVGNAYFALSYAFNAIGDITRGFAAVERLSLMIEFPSVDELDLVRGYLIHDCALNNLSGCDDVNEEVGYGSADYLDERLGLPRPDQTLPPFGYVHRDATNLGQRAIPLINQKRGITSFDYGDAAFGDRSNLLAAVEFAEILRLGANFQSAGGLWNA